MADTVGIEGETEHAAALRYANEAWTAEQENFEKGRDDQRFYASEQWDPNAKQKRDDANRPVMTINRLTSFVRQVTGDVRKDTPSIKVAPSKDGASEETAEVFNGLIRHIEQQSNAKAAYVSAVENACVTGMGSFRVKAAYSSSTSFDQDLIIERLPDPFQVLYDPAAREPDKADGRRTFLFTQIPKEQYVKDYPDSPISSMPTGPNAMMGMSWWSADTVTIAEYWYLKPVKKKLYQLDDGTITEELPEGAVPIDQRDVEIKEVCMRLMSGVEFLTDEIETPFTDWIPIVPVIGEELFIEGRVLRRGLVRDAKDAQRIYNYMRTAATEATGNQPKAPWMVTVDMISGLESHWDSLGSENPPYIVYKPDPKAPGAKPERAQPALAQAGLDQQAMIAADDIKAVTGIYDASLGAKSNETSGRAILARQREGDTGTFHFIDNLGTAQRHLGRILVRAIPKIYAGPRIVRVLGEDGEGEMQPINHPMVPGPNGQPQLVDPVSLDPDEMKAIQKLNDLGVGEYEVTVVTGKSFATRRQEGAESMTEIMKTAPDMMKVAGDLFFKSLDVPYAQEIAKRVRRSIPKNLLEDQDGPVPPPPEVVVELEKKTAETAKIRAETEGQGIENVTSGIGVMQMLMQLKTTMEQIQAGLAPLAAGPQPPQQQAAPPPGPPQGALPPPMPQMDDSMAALEPMGAPAGDLEPMQPAVAA